MNKLMMIFPVFIISIPVFSQNCKHDSSTFRCVKYISNYDGDTIKFHISNTHPLLGDKISIRVNGVDTPEMRTKDKCEKKLAKMSKEFVQEILLKAKNIELRNIERGKYFRVVADVYIDGKSIKESLFKYKLAVQYNGGTKSKVDWCKQFEKMKRKLASEGFPVYKNKNH